MIKMDIKGTLGKFGYAKVAESIMDDLLKIGVDQAYMTAIRSAPVDPNDPPIHIRDELKKDIDKDGKVGYVYVKLPYANIAEFGSKNRLPHPYIRPASRAAQAKIRATIRKAVKQSIAEEKAEDK